MAKNILMTMDFHEASTSNRDVFDSVMARYGWDKSEFVSTAWTKAFPDTSSTEIIAENISLSVVKAAERAEIDEYDGLVQIGNNPAYHFN